MDFEDIFLAIVRLETFQEIMALIVALDLKVGSWDVIAAFLNALIDQQQQIYVRPPLGYTIVDSNGNQLVWHLLHALYGLQQAPCL